MFISKKINVHVNSYGHYKKTWFFTKIFDKNQIVTFIDLTNPS